MNFIHVFQCGNNDDQPCNITCFIDRLNCYILDNNAYVVLSDEPEFIGRYMGDIRPDIMQDLINDKVFIPTRMFNYQAICQKPSPKILTAQERLLMKKERTGAKSSSTTLFRVSISFNIFLGLVPEKYTHKTLQYPVFVRICHYKGINFHSSKVNKNIMNLVKKGSDI